MLLVMQHPHMVLGAARHAVTNWSVPLLRLPAKQRRWQGAGGGCVLGHFHLSVPFLSHAVLGSSGRGGGASRLPSSKKRSWFLWCWWVLLAGLQPPARMLLLSPGCTRALLASPAPCCSLPPRFEESVSLQVII